MAQTDQGVGNYDITREGEDVVLRINYEGATAIPSIEDSPQAMARVIDILAETGSVSKIIFSQKRDYEYDYTQTLIIVEIAKLYKTFVKERITEMNLGDLNAPHAKDVITKRYTQVAGIIYNLFRSDPLGAFVELKRLVRHEQIMLDELPVAQVKGQKIYIEYLKALVDRMRETKLVKLAGPYLPGYDFENRDVYRKIFSPSIKPDFMYTKLMTTFPAEAEERGSYSVGSTEVTIYNLPDSVQTRYHMVPPEFKMSEEKYELLDQARNILAEHKPTKEEFTDPARMRQVFHDIGSDLLEELSEGMGIRMSLDELEDLTQILVRYTVGFGLIELLLADEQVQDITINSPMGRQPVFIVHGEFGDCVTNIVPTPAEAESWASKLRLISGRPLDEANPILDTSLELPHAAARIAVIGPPLNPSGLAYAFRRHRDRPWTLPLMIKGGMVNPLAAGLLSFLIDGSRTMLVAGTRSAGKTSLLSSLITEIMRRFRIITVEDTLELPVPAWRRLGYNVQPMKVASALTKAGTEVSAAEGIRTTLRLGDSALIVGEVRSSEAKALYEAMRVGALANVVAGTIHGDSPYGVYDRVVNDLEVPRTSFKATDIIVVANPIRSPDGLHKWRRVTQITEIRKHWEEDPLREGGFVDLMNYDSKTDQLIPSDDLVNGDSEILKGIAGNVKEWAGDWDAVWDNVLLRAKTKQRMLEISEQVKRPELLEAEFVLTANDMFHYYSDQVRTQMGTLDSERIYFLWNEWLLRSLRKTEVASLG
ncbi:MAG: ATPase, T2SS/T4P/T4SS family [Candidatus Nanoarchaeia archaeon]